MNYLGVYTLLKKETDKVMRIWKQTVIAPLVTNMLFLVIFGVAFAGRGGSGDQPYLSVLIPGLAAMGLMTNALQNPMGSLVLAKYTHHIQDILMLPMQGYELAIGYIGGGILRGVMVAVATIVIGAFFTPLSFAHPLLILLFTLLLGGIFASIGVILGIVSKDFDQGSILPTFVLTPLIYLGGVFFSVQSLPGIFGSLAKFNPMLYLVDGFRYSFLSTGDTALWTSLSVTTLLFALTFGIASWMFQAGYKLKT